MNSFLSRGSIVSVCCLYALFVCQSLTIASQDPKNPGHEQIGTVMGRAVYRDQLRTGKNVTQREELFRLFAQPVKEQYISDRRKSLVPTEQEITYAAAFFCRDQQIRRQEAQAAVLRGVGPAVTAVIHRLAPRLAEAGLAEHVATALDEALETRPDPAPVIRCAAESAQGLERALAASTGRFAVETDPRLTPLEVELHWRDGFDSIDIAGLLAAIDRALETALSPPGNRDVEEEHANG